MGEGNSTEKLLVYKSSAGSGKTYTLVQQFLKMALRSPQPERIRNMLAITFTNKAAAEMKQRVISALQQIVHDDDSEKRSELAVLLRLDGLEVKARAQEALTYLLHHYSDFSILTIDKFFQRVARAFAFDLDLPMQFKLEVSNDEILEQSVDRVMDKIGRDPQLSALVIDQAIRKVEDDGNWRIDTALASRAKHLFSERGKSRISPWMDDSLEELGEVLKNCHQQFRTMRQKVSSPARAIVQLMDGKGIDRTQLQGKTNNVMRYVMHAATLSDKYLDLKQTNIKYLLSEHWAHKDAEPEMEAAIESIQDQLCELGAELVNVVAEYKPKILELKAILSGLYEVILMRELQKEMDALITEENRVHLSSFVERIANVVLNEPVPYIYERMGERYHHIFIDEFQDTSILQWLNLVPMIDNALAFGQENMLVGDAKQAIYRWRGGDVEQFTALPKLPAQTEYKALGQYAGSIERNYFGDVLKDNYRSAPAVVNFVNDLFGHMESLPEMVQEVFKAHRQNVKRTDIPGWVHIRELEPTDINERLEQVIAQLHESRSRNYQWADMAILCRSNRTAALMAEGVKSAGIPVTSGDSLKLDQHLPVRFIVYALYLISDPNREDVWGGLLVALHEFGVLTKGELLNFKVLKKEQSFDQLLEQLGLAKALFVAGNKPLFELVANLIKACDFLDEKDPYLLMFQDLVLQFQSSEWGNIDQFLPWWESQKHTLCLSEDATADAVKVLTIHKSKGLEYPVVILPTLVMGTPTQTTTAWLDVEQVDGVHNALITLGKTLEGTQFEAAAKSEEDKLLMDDLNLLYVALTRAADELHCWSAPKERSRNSYKITRAGMEAFKEWNGAGLSQGEPSVNPRESIIQVANPLKRLTEDRQFIPLRTSPALRTWSPDGAKLKGEAIHWVLDRLVTSGQQAGLVRRCVQKFRLSAALEKEVIQTIDRLVEKGWLELIAGKQGRVLSEWSMLQNGRIFRPDKVVVKNDMAVVVDFKTGAKDDSHNKQVRRYVDAMESAGYNTVKGYLLYTESAEIVPV